MPFRPPERPSSSNLVFKQMVLGWVLHIDTSDWGYWDQALGVLFIILAQAVLNHVGVRLLARVGEAGAYITFAGAVMLLGVLLYNIHPANLSHIIRFVNNTGDAGGNVVPRTTNLILVYGYALLLPLWIITSYDASAHASEETIDAARSVPKAMVNSVLLSTVVGFLLLTALGLAMNDQAAIAKEGANAFATLFNQIRAPVLLKDFVSVAMVLAQFICGACCLTGFSRAVFAFSRDKGLPSLLRSVSPKFRTPAVAIWACAGLSFLATLNSSALADLVAGTALFYQLCYGMAIFAALVSKKREYGPYRLGIWSKPLGIVGIAGSVFLIWVGLQPPTAALIQYFAGLFFLLVFGWFGLERRRFPGPPIDGFTIGKRQAEIYAEEAAVGEE